jgi:hypothetical protein
MNLSIIFFPVQVVEQREGFHKMPLLVKFDQPVTVIRIYFFIRNLKRNC